MCTDISASQRLTMLPQAVKNRLVVRGINIIIFRPVCPVVGNVQTDAAVARLRYPEPVVFQRLQQNQRRVHAGAC